jgi:multiple sugar transport system permease protein
MRRQGIGLSDLACGFALAIALFVFLAPVLWMLITAVKPPGEWLNEPPVFIPSELHWANFTDALFKWGGLKGLTDSLIVASLSTALSLLLGVPAAYAIGRYQTGGDNLSFTVLSILFMPPVAVAIPMYLFWSALGLIDTYTALILQYMVFNIPFLTWVLKGFFEDIPRDMEDSAMVNGATRWRAFWEIAVPLARPAILAVSLLAFIFSWNEFFFALILTRANVTTLPFILPVLMEGHDVLWGDIAAIATLGALPVVLLAFALQKYLVRGLSFGTLR